VPSHHGVRLNDEHCPETAGPEAVEQNPEGPIQLRQTSLGSWRALQNLQLMTKSHNLELQGSSTPKADYEAVEKGTKNCVHISNAMVCNPKTPGFLRRIEFMGGTTPQ
jgi:hypothetical protein